MILVYLINGNVDEVKFYNYWDELSCIVFEIEKELIGGEFYEWVVKSLLICDFSFSRIEIY